MKVIVSHDVDHLTFSEHFRDWCVPKYLLRTGIELGLRRISVAETGRRLGALLRNRWHNLDALMQFDREQEVPATFFVAMARGRGLCYAPEVAAEWVRRIHAQGFAVGVHGVAFEDLNDIRREYATFRESTQSEPAGVRMHYLRTCDATLGWLARAGYAFDSSVYELAPPYKIHGLWEFPLHLMDGHLFYTNGRWQSANLVQARDATLRRLDAAHRNDVRYFTLLFHDVYFSDAFLIWKKWYVWLIDHLKQNDFEFVDYGTAVQELERGVAANLITPSARVGVSL